MLILRDIIRFFERPKGYSIFIVAPLLEKWQKERPMPRFIRRKATDIEPR